MTSHKLPANVWFFKLFMCFAVIWMAACLPHHGVRTTSGTKVPRLSAQTIAQLMPPSVTDRPGWASDMLSVLESLHLDPDPTSICMILAVVEQESGFNANPQVPGLARMVQKRLDEYASHLGPFGPPAVDALLKGKAPGTRSSFKYRLGQVKTELDLDRVYRDVLAYYQSEFPATYAAANLLGELFNSRRLEDLNPITTAGSMQVSVRFARQLAEANGRDPDEVREELYTRRGGLYYGIARLLAYEADYDQPLYRFADYNAGPYASRNAAVQSQLNRLTGSALTPDGDLLAYSKAGKPLDTDTHSLKAILEFRRRYASDLTERHVRRDVRQEKRRDFEETDTYRKIKRRYREVAGKTADYARLPEVTISSPKLKGTRSTAWFARSVEKRYNKFKSRYKDLLQLQANSKFDN